MVTINLPYIALLANKDINKFEQELDKYMSIVHRALQARHNRLKGTLTDVSPIHWQYGAIARLNSGEPIDKLLYNGYSTISIGVAGLWECVLALNGYKLNEEKGAELGKIILTKINDYAKKWKQEENIDYSVYGTPLESTTYKFAKAIRRDFGLIKGVTDKDYVTNSYHIHVTEPIDIFSKFKIESEFQNLTPGGAIMYGEIPNMQNNINGILQIIDYIYNNVMYAELNTKLDYCQKCGYDGEIQIKGEQGKYYWQCPNCGNTDQSSMNIIRRTCGYLGSNYWNQGRTEEIKERVLHLD